MTDVLTAEKWLYSKLSVDGTVKGLIGSRIYHDLAPAQTIFPYLIYSLVFAEPRRVVGASVIWFDEVWQVKAVDQGMRFTGIGPVIDRVRSLLDRTSGTISGGTVVACYEIGKFELTEVDPSGRPYKHLGLEYRIYTQ